MTQQGTNGREAYRLVVISDIHCGDARFDHELLRNAVAEINELCPDLVLVTGDLTADGYREEFVEAKEYIDQIGCPRKVVLPGNHDTRNVGDVYFQEMFGPRYNVYSFPFEVPRAGSLQREIRVVAADSAKPDLNDGEIGRDHHGWIASNFADSDCFKLFALHHHLMGVPGTGRERNIVWDAGDVLAVLRDCGVELVVSGHKHVPHTWQVGDMLIVNSGTVSTHRSRGFVGPSYTMVEVLPDRINVSFIAPGSPRFKKESFERPKAHPQIKQRLAETAVEVEGRPHLKRDG